MEVSQSRVSQLYGQFQEAGEAGLVVKKATGAPPKLTTEQRAQLPELLSKGAEHSGFEGEVWTRLRVGEVIKPHFGEAEKLPRLVSFGKNSGLLATNRDDVIIVQSRHAWYCGRRRFYRYSKKRRKPKSDSF